MQSLIAVGSGGLLGLGPGNSVQKLYFLPHPESDFIYAIVAEELGMIGALTVVGLFGLVLWRGLRAGWRSPDPFGRYLAWGFTSMLVMQALINISVAIALLPTKGIPLPFLSYGGSSLVVTMVICGVLLNVSQTWLTKSPSNAAAAHRLAAPCSRAVARAATSFLLSLWATSSSGAAGA